MAARPPQERELDTALQVAQQVGNPCQLWRTYAARGALRRAQGRAQGAHQAYQAALALIDGVAAALRDTALPDTSLRETFLTSAHIQHLRQMEQARITLQNTPSREATVPARLSLPARPGGLPGAATGRRPARAERQAWAVEHLRTSGPLSPRAYAAAMGVSVDTALRDLQELVGRGLVHAMGTTRDRCYGLADDAVGPAIHRSAL